MIIVTQGNIRMILTNNPSLLSKRIEAVHRTGNYYQGEAILRRKARERRTRTVGIILQPHKAFHRKQVYLEKSTRIWR